MRPQHNEMPEITPLSNVMIVALRVPRAATCWYMCMVGFVCGCAKGREPTELPPVNWGCGALMISTAASIQFDVPPQSVAPCFRAKHRARRRIRP